MAAPAALACWGTVFVRRSQPVRDELWLLVRVPAITTLVVVGGFTAVLAARELDLPPEAGYPAYMLAAFVGGLAVGAGVGVRGRQVGRLGSGWLTELSAVVALIAAYLLLARTVLREWLLPPAG